MVKCEICGKEFKDAQGLAGHMQFKHSEPSGNDAGGSRALAQTKSTPVDVLIQQLNLPEIVDGSSEVFNSGVAYGMRSILIGVRVAQELSKMGIDQASPIIKMSQEMRQAEGQAASTAAHEAAQETASRVADYFDQKMEQKKPDIASTPNPMQGVMARWMEMMGDRMMAKVLPQPGGQGEAQPQLAPGWKRRREKSDDNV